MIELTHLAYFKDSKNHILHRSQLNLSIPIEFSTDYLFIIRRLIQLLIFGGRQQTASIFFMDSIIFRGKVNNNQLLILPMEIEDGFQRRKPRKIRVKIKTNRGLDFITAVRVDATISDLANRALSVYMELSEDGRLPTTKKQLTVSAVKQGIFYMPKSELVASLLNNDDEVEVVIIKAKPKYPNQIFQNNQILTQANKQSITRPEMQLSVPVIKAKEIVEEDEAIIEEQKQQLDNFSCISKRQKKRQKKQEKQRIKLQAKQKQIQNQKSIQKNQEKKKEQPKELSSIQKSQTKNDLPLEKSKDVDCSQEGAPRKRLKFDKEEIAEKAPPPPPKIIPSPKITFHNEPRLESPKFFILGESSKKKLEGQARKQSEQFEKRNQLEKIISPAIAARSPLIYQRSPNMPPPESTKPKEKDQLSNFSLNFRKLSEDKKTEIKKEKAKDEIHSTRKEQLKNSYKKDEDRDSIPVESQDKSLEKMDTEKKEVEKKETAIIQKKIEPPKPKVVPSMIVVEQDDSDSQQNKKSNCPYVHHRQKQLSEIQQKINEFYIHSDDQ